MCMCVRVQFGVCASVKAWMRVSACVREHVCVSAYESACVSECVRACASMCV